MYSGGYGGGEVTLHLIFGVLFFIILVALAVILVRVALGGGRRRWMMMRDSALETLKDRYAKGEIDKKEFEEKKKDLMSDR